MSATGRRGRPVGSVSLTPQIQETIITYILAGAYDHVAAEAAEVSLRTFYDWMARGEGTHPTRPPTPKLRRFAREVRRAQAQARAAAEIEVRQQDPKFWLTRVARSKPDREGWTDPRQDQESGADTLARRIAERDAAKAALPDCPDASCPCPHHQRKDA